MKPIYYRGYARLPTIVSAICRGNGMPTTHWNSSIPCTLREDLEALRDALADFQPREQEIIIRRYLWQQKPMELAKHFPSLKPRSISQLLLRARKRLYVLADQ